MSKLEIPEQYLLHPAYSIPFNPSTTVSYEVGKDGNVSLIVYNMLGREVVRLVDSYQNASYRAITWDASKMVPVYI